MSVDPAAAGRVSVVIPTYHRPAMLVAAVESVLAQEGQHRLREVVIALSDPNDDDDRAAAAELQRRDPRIRIAEASGPGPGAARNAGIAASTAPVLAFLDDDCVAQPGWLAGGVAAMRDQGLDLVQGRVTPPVESPPPYHHTLWVQSVSGWFETCNLFVRREAVERGGVFDETFNPTGRVGGHWGEDTEWGWRLVRAGARHGYAEAAYAHHCVIPRSYLGYLGYRSRVRYFPLLVRSTPEVRGIFYRRYFLDRHHVTLTAAAGLLVTASVARVARRRAVARGLGAAAFAAYVFPLRHELRAREARLRLLRPREMLRELVDFGSLIYGSVRWRRVVL